MLAYRQRPLPIHLSLVDSFHLRTHPYEHVDTNYLLVTHMGPSSGLSYLSYPIPPYLPRQLHYLSCYSH